jgi:hypothetical protein
MLVFFLIVAVCYVAWGVLLTLCKFPGAFGWAIAGSLALAFWKPEAGGIALLSLGLYARYLGYR